MDDIYGLTDCISLTNINLSHNEIDKDENKLKEMMSIMQNLACLNLQNNPIQKEFRNYRRTFISILKNLKHLDDR